MNETGTIVWSLYVPNAYEAERLNTGDESTRGTSATASNLPSESIPDARETEESSLAGTVKKTIKGFFPTKVRNAVANVTPAWVGVFEVVVAESGISALVLWLGLEFRWSEFALRLPVTRNNS